MSNVSECWCGKPHPEDPADFHEACTNLGHFLIAEMRIPQLVDWLDLHLPGTWRGR